MTTEVKFEISSCASSATAQQSPVLTMQTSAFLASKAAKPQAKVFKLFLITVGHNHLDNPAPVILNSSTFTRRFLIITKA
ncbi:MAG: hypothetical protein RSI33_11205, partial [Clostridia bacterium]